MGIIWYRSRSKWLTKRRCQKLCKKNGFSFKWINDICFSTEKDGTLNGFSIAIEEEIIENNCNNLMWG